jgi:hypothetical protein
MHMKKKLLLALMLASSLALAQSGSSPGSTDPQQPSTQQTQPPGGQSSQGSAAQTSMTGCLKGSDGGWVLIAEGQSAPVPVTGDSSTLSPHNGHQVQVKGNQASDGSFQVTEVVMIGETCTKPQSDASSGMGAAAGAAAGAATGASTATKGAASEAAQATQSATSDAAQATQSPSGGAAQATPGPTSGAPSSTESQTAPKTYSDQGAGQEAKAGKGAGQKLPQTASPLPLLGLLGLGSLVSGLIARRK